MSLKVVRRLKKPETELVPTGVQCNACGREQAVEESNIHDFMHDFHHIELGGGYGDDYPEDLSTLTFMTCGDCLKKWTDTFVVPPTYSRYQEVKTVEATHSETLETWVVDTTWAYPKGTEFDIPDESHPPEGVKYPTSGIYEHYKGNRYEVECSVLAGDVAAPEVFVVYQALYGESQRWIRPLTMWNEEVTVDGHLIPRFRLLG